MHDITALRQHTRSDDVGRGMTSPPLDSKHGWTASGIKCHHRVWKAHTFERLLAWHAITAVEQHTRSNDFWRGMPSPPLGSTHGRTTLGVECHHHLWAAQMVERRRTWHEITALGLHKRSNDVERGMPSFAFGQHKRSNDVRRGKTSPALYSTHGRTTSCVA